MPVVSAGDLTSLRSEYQKTAVRLSWLVPPVLWSARINDVSIVKGETGIAFDTGSGSYFSIVEAFQEVWVGTTAGDNDVGRLRLRSVSSGDGGVTGSITVGGHSHPLQDDLHLTFLHDYPLKPKYSYIDPATETWYFDDNVLYTDQHTKPPPVVIAGPHRAGFLISGTATFNVDASASYTIASGATKSSYALSVASTAGTPAVNFNTGTGLGDITFTAAGVYWAKYSVTDSNGKTQISYRCYILHVADDPISSDAPWTDCEEVQLEADWENGGWTAGVKAHDNMTLADIPDHTLCIIWHTPWYEGSIKHITFLPDDNPAVFVGYVREDSGIQQMAEGFGEVDLVLSTIEGRLRQMFTFSTSLIVKKTTPGEWWEYEKWQTCGTIVHDLFLWRSTLLEMTDVIGLRDDTLNRMFQGFDEGNIYDNANNFLYSEGIRKKILSDQGGRLHLVEDQQLMIDADRTALTTSFPLIQTAAIADYGAAFAIQRKQEFEAPFVTANGIYWDGNTWDDEDRPSSENNEFCSIAPGGKPLWEGPDPQDFPKQTVSSQDHLNQICGRYEAKVNNPVTEVVVEFHGMYNTVLDIAYGERHIITLQTSETPRGIVWADKPLYTKHIQAVYEAGPGFWAVNAAFEPENITTDGIYTECPSFPPLGGVVPPPGVGEPAGALLTGASVNFKSAIGSLWDQRLTQDVKDLIEDPYWHAKTGSTSPDDAIVFRCGVGYIKRSTDAFDAVDVNVTPGTNPPNDAGDSPAPVATGVTYFMMEGSYPNQDEFAVLARWQNASSAWRSWIAFTDDNGTTWSWKSFSEYDTPEIDTFGSLQDIGTYKTGALTGWNEFNPQRAVAKLSDTKVVFLNDWIDPLGTAESKMQVVAASISGNTITEGAFYDITSAEWNTPLHGSITEMTSNNFLVMYLDYSGSGIYTPTLIAGTVSGTTISLGSKIDFVSEYSSDYEKYWRDSVVCRLTDSLAVVGIIYNARIVFHLISVSGNVCSFTGTVSNNTSFDCYRSFSMARLTDTKFVVAFQAGAVNNLHIQAMICTISGGTISLGSIYDATDLLTYNHWKIHCTALTEDRFIISSMVYDYPPDDYQLLHVVQGRANGTVITFGVHTTAYTNESTIWALRTQNTDRISDVNFILHFAPNDSVDDTQQFLIGYADPSLSIWFYDPISVNTMPDYDHESWNSYVRMLSSDKAVLWRVENDDLDDEGYIYQGSAYIINLTGGPSYETYANGLSIAKVTGDKAWVTVGSDLGLNLVEVALPGLAISDTYSLGSSTIAQIISQTYLAYPFVPFGYDDAVYIYGRMDDPQSLGSPAHIIRTEDGGSSFGLIEDGWGANHCGALALELANTLFAIRNAPSGAKLYVDDADNVLLLKLTLPFFAQVAPHGMLLDYYTLDVYACAWSADMWMVAKIGSPYLAASNLTFDHDATAGIESIVVL